MPTQLEIHPVQIAILRVLLFNPKAKFSEMNTEKISSDHFNFHVKTLIEQDLIHKSQEGQYMLTVRGKEFANRFDTDINKIERQAKIGVMIGAIKEENGKKYYLLQKRLKQPFFGYIGFLGGKIRWGETVEEAGKREFLEETGMTGDIRLVAVKHKMDYAEDGSFLEDKYFMMCCAENIAGDLIEEFEGGKNMWMTLGDVQSSEDVFDGIEEAIQWLDNTSVLFAENKYTVKGY